MWYVYSLKSLKDGNLYTGMSKNPEKRLKEHNLGMTRSTAPRRPFKIIYEEGCRNKLNAREREKYLKSGAGREFLKELSTHSSIGRAGAS